MALVSISAYAKHRKCSRQAVLKAIDTGRITRGPRGLIDPDAADAEWKARTHPRAARGAEKAKRTRARVLAAAAPDSGSPPTAPPDAEPPAAPPKVPALGEDIPDTISLDEADRLNAIYKAKRSKLDYEAKIAGLVPAEQVGAVWFDMGRMVRDAVLNISSRISPILAATNTTEEVDRLLTAELRQALENLASDPLGKSHS